MDSIVTFHCPANLTLRGSRKSKCQINGSWIPKIPKCESLFVYFYIQSITFRLLVESISCSIPSLPPHGRYLHHHPLAEHIHDGSQLVYTCGNSRHRRRIICRKGKILPRLPKCFSGKINRNSNFHAKIMILF